MDDPKEGGLLTPDDAAGLPTGSVRDFLLRCVFIFAFISYSISNNTIKFSLLYENFASFLSLPHLYNSSGWIYNILEIF